MLKKTLLAGIAMLTMSLYSQTDKVKILKLSPKKTKMLVRTNGIIKAKKGQKLYYNDQCSFIVLKSNQNKILLSTKDCSLRARLEKNSTLLLTAKKNRGARPPKNFNTVSSNSQSNSWINQKSSKGFRIGLNQASLSGSLNIESSEYSSISTTIEDDIEYQYGINLGYVNIGLNRPGFMGHLTHTQFDKEIDSLRATANGTYAFHESFYLYGGINIHKFTNQVSAENFDPGVGYQAGIGFQITPMIGIDVNYLVLRNKGSNNEYKLDYDLEMSGVEATLHFTF